MNGYDIYRRAMTLLGYTDANGDVSDGDGLLKRALSAVNQIGADLCGMTPLTVLTEEVPVPGAALEALPCGVAMLLALGEGDGGKNELFCELYNAKRASAKAARSFITDCLPVDDGGWER